tara:strand:- start:1026 stop:1532 length:507 start_codon:yes stop_codon:yes gene_type:complete
VLSVLSAPPSLASAPAPALPLFANERRSSSAARASAGDFAIAFDCILLFAFFISAAAVLGDAMAGGLGGTTAFPFPFLFPLPWAAAAAAAATTTGCFTAAEVDASSAGGTLPPPRLDERSELEPSASEGEARLRFRRVRRRPEPAEEPPSLSTQHALEERAPRVRCAP